MEQSQPAQAITEAVPRPRWRVTLVPEVSGPWVDEAPWGPRLAAALSRLVRAVGRLGATGVRLATWPLVGVLLALLFAASRLTNLSLLPAFYDEIIYLEFARRFRADPTQAFLSLARDGKPPLLPWLTAAMMEFVPDPLLAARLVSVVAGVGVVLGIYLAGRALFSRQVGALAALLSILGPFTIMRDRLGLYDSLLTAWAVAILYFSVRLVRRPGLVPALLLGLSLGLSFLTKPASAIFPLLIPVAFVLIPWRDLRRPFYLLRLGVFTALAYSVGELLYTPLRANPDFYRIDQENEGYMMTWPQLLRFPVEHWRQHLVQLQDWGVSYLGYGLLVLLAVAVLYWFVRPSRAHLLVLVWAFAPVVAVTLVAQNWFFPRYVAFAVPAMMLAMAYVFCQLARHVDGWLTAWWRRGIAQAALLLALGASLTPLLAADYFILHDPVQAPLARIDRWQFVSGWPAGYGVTPVIEFLRQEATRREIEVFVDHFNQMPDETIFYNLNYLRPRIWFSRPDAAFYGRDWRPTWTDRPRYLVTSRAAPPTLHARLVPVVTGYKPGKQSWLTVYQIVPAYQPYLRGGYEKVGPL